MMASASAEITCEPPDVAQTLDVDMSDSSVADSADDAGLHNFSNLTKTQAEKKLKSGEFKLVEKSADVRNKELWRKFRIVVTENEGKTESTNFVCCVDCNELFKHHSQKSGTTHLKNHMQGETCNKIKSAKKGSPTQTSLKGFLVPSVSTQHKRARTVARKHVLEMCARDVKPFTLVEGKGFRGFAQSMIDLGAQMGKMNVEDILPDRRTVSNDAKALFEQEKQELGKMLKSRISQGRMIGATTDLWTDDIKHQHYMSLTLHLEDNWSLFARLATLKFLSSSVNKTAANLRVEILTAFKELGVDAESVKSNVVFTTDCGANIVKAMSVYRWTSVTGSF